MNKLFSRHGVMGIVICFRSKDLELKCCKNITNISQEGDPKF